MSGCFSLVLPVGIEPTFPPSEGDVLSIERRKQIATQQTTDVCTSAGS